MADSDLPREPLRGRRQRAAAKPKTNPLKSTTARRVREGRAAFGNGRRVSVKVAQTMAPTTGPEPLAQTWAAYNEAVSNRLATIPAAEAVARAYTKPPSLDDPPDMEFRFCLPTGTRVYRHLITGRLHFFKWRGTGLIDITDFLQPAAAKIVARYYKSPSCRASS